MRVGDCQRVNHKLLVKSLLTDMKGVNVLGRRCSFEVWFHRCGMDGNVGNVTPFVWQASFFCRGFGSRMANTPMVIMWMNSDGTATLSQRRASTEAMPTVVSDPPRTATFSSTLSVVWQPSLVIVPPSEA